jgi:hypothetical protein
VPCADKLPRLSAELHVHASHSLPFCLWILFWAWSLGCETGVLLSAIISIPAHSDTPHVQDAIVLVPFSMFYERFYYFCHGHFVDVAGLRPHFSNPLTSFHVMPFIHVLGYVFKISWPLRMYILFANNLYHNYNILGQVNIWRYTCHERRLQLCIREFAEARGRGGEEQ